MTRSAFIVIEGIDGAGTTTQVERLVAALESSGVAAHETREPSDGPVGRMLREILGGAHQPVDGTTMALLFAADRADHLAREITPALDRGAVVVSDRYYHSSLAYQSTAEAGAFIERVNSFARAPDLTVFLRVEPDVAAGRRTDRGQAEELYEKRELQRLIASNYETVLAELRATENIVIIDGGRGVDEVFADVHAAAKALLEGAR